MSGDVNLLPRVLISIPVHEQPDVVLNQIRNIRRFVPGAVVVLHLSRRFRRDFTPYVGRLPKGVFVNDESVLTGHADGSQLTTHLSNVRFAERKGLVADFFIPQASNELFVREGVLSYLAGYEGAFQQILVDDSSNWLHGRCALKDKRLALVCKELGVTQIMGSQLEGSYYPWGKIKDLADVCNNHREPLLYQILQPIIGMIDRRSSSWGRRVRRKFLGGLFYAKEEVYFPTMFSDQCCDYAEPFCYMDWSVDLNLTIDDVEKVRSGAKDQLLSEGKLRRFFSVKRVDRRMDDPVRIHIEHLPPSA